LAPARLVVLGEAPAGSSGSTSSGTIPGSCPHCIGKLALHLDAAYEANRSHLDDLIWAFRTACLFLVLEVLAWVVNIAVVT